MKKRVLAVMMTALMVLGMAGCGSSSADTVASYYRTEAATTEEAVEYEEAEYDDYEVAESDSGVSSGSGIESVTDTSRKLIKTVNLSLQTTEFDSVLESISARTTELGGYIESSSVSGNSYYYESTRYAYYTIRIPSDRLDEFVDVVGDLGNVTYKSESVEDVTLEHTDVESHKTALETEQERLLELLEEAENMEDLLAIESKLSEVRYELESYESQLRVLDNQVDYSTVYVDVDEVERITETAEKGFFGQIADRFNDSLYSVGKGLRNFVIVFVGSLPVLAVWAVVIAVIVLILRRISRGRKDKKAAMKRKYWDGMEESGENRPEATERRKEKKKKPLWARRKESGETGENNKKEREDGNEERKESPDDSVLY
ncbi:MAG: DUF4349 domain-containing protein [Lachnospiraceae bacterium]|nr:DUF4349 domain-containing protein [Lachnospiraceae bacterium]